jgi:hypothetical protein
MQELRTLIKKHQVLDYGNDDEVIDNRDNLSYNEIVLQYPSYADKVRKDMQLNLLPNEELNDTGSHKRCAWFSVKPKPTTKDKKVKMSSDEQKSFAIPYPNSNTSIVTFFNGQIKAICKQGTDNSKAVVAPPLKNRSGQILLEFTL